jgi:hypothetical protein
LRIKSLSFPHPSIDPFRIFSFFFLLYSTSTLSLQLLWPRITKSAMAVADTLMSLLGHLAFYSLVLFSLITTYAVGVILYRLTLHPLAKYPGPFLAKITDIHLAYHAWKGDRHLQFYRCHEKYGSCPQCAMSLATDNL